MQAGSKLPDISKKETLREKLHTANNVIKQLKHENEQLKKESSKLEIKVTMLTSLIDEVLWPEGRELQEIAKEEMKRIGV